MVRQLKVPVGFGADLPSGPLFQGCRPLGIDFEKITSATFSTPKMGLRGYFWSVQIIAFKGYFWVVTSSLFGQAKKTIIIFPKIYPHILHMSPIFGQNFKN